ncbi:MAG: ATP-dependent sacrificial sulfur transferase LarE [Candidatus Omnitrophota bacterium]|nr:MAG: ATP-dependent sacrificial sulfur transferase LarE [Candidatus Omnitrophota bacterium]
MAAKIKKLEKIIKDMDSALLAYSGGLDSTFLLKVASKVLGTSLIAVTAKSETYPEYELRSAKKSARKLKVRHIIIKTNELKDPRFSANPKNRCYFCKKELFSLLLKLAKKNNTRFVIDASNLTDKKDYRPGSVAKKELGIRSPLQEAGFTKDDIRSASKMLGLDVWDKPAFACLASRIPYGDYITPKLLKRIEYAESLIRGLGFRQNRVRDYGRQCRIEVPLEDLQRLLKSRDLVIGKFKKLGYNYITLDLEGYRSGSMNTVLKKDKL